MRVLLVVGGLTLALLVTSAVPAFAQGGPPWAQSGRGPAWQTPATGPGPAVAAPAAGFRTGRGPGAGIGATIPSDVHKSIEAAAHANAAKALGITPQALEQQLAAGKTMAQIAAQRNVPLSQVQIAIQNGRRAAINQALKAGKINQVQADALLRAGPRFGPAGRNSAPPVAGSRPGIGRGYASQPGYGPHRGMARGAGHMRFSMHRFGPGR